MYNNCMKTRREKTKRVEVKIPESLAADLLENLAPWHGVQKYAILAAIRVFSELPINEKLERINDEVSREKAEKK